MVNITDSDTKNVCRTREQAVQYIKEHPNGDYWIDEVESEGFE